MISEVRYCIYILRYFNKTKTEPVKLDGLCNLFQSCDDQNIAKKMCEECEEYLCEDCVKAHKRVKVTKDHVITEINVRDDEADTGNGSSSVASREIPCPVHQVTYSVICR